MALGALPGVIDTRAGWLDKKEVVEVLFDPKVTSYAKLLQQAQCVEKPSTAFAHDAQQLEIARKALGAKAASLPGKTRDAKAPDRKYYLRKATWWHLPMTRIQAVRANALLGAKKDPSTVFSPRQLRLHGHVVKAGAKLRKAMQELQPARDVADFRAYVTKLRRLLQKRRDG